MILLIASLVLTSSTWKVLSTLFRDCSVVRVGSVVVAIVGEASACAKHSHIHAITKRLAGVLHCRREKLLPSE